ncbi:hypothetical protein G7K_2415-t1 [Saitoella complicata NRRL Y-17804]|uniref:Uncharacterized protein n=1 Tax=Saitoella complicata (strain BCRC 22490 / CBS 7301 / JCM 7358 / NBRC 10748 / NRRL Y-17804) TaxID=698492 RepID=A0A0E9NFP7_SAICN|nr:hypothetical protein G7K_2415-t1 [Saitoella complicata NRRL Y-17804]
MTGSALHYVVTEIPTFISCVRRREVFHPLSYSLAMAPRPRRMHLFPYPLLVLQLTHVVFVLPIFATPFPILGLLLPLPLPIITIPRKLPTIVIPSKQMTTGMRIAHSRGGKRAWTGWSASTKGIRRIHME